MKAEKYDPRYIYRDSPRHYYEDFFDWLRQHPLWIILFVLAYPYYLITTEEV